ncbi:MAG: type II toxin-antitoxin system RelE/ParE family toxin [Thermodesulfobacteriota bacterium]
MKHRVMIRPEAEADLIESFSWYEDKRQGLGYDFLLQVEAGLNFIIKDPAIHPPAYKGTRKHFIKRFPYKRIYLIEHETIIVLAVIHGRRSSELINERMNDIYTLRHK